MYHVKQYDDLQITRLRFLKQEIRFLRFRSYTGRIRQDVEFRRRRHGWRPTPSVPSAITNYHAKSVRNQSRS